MDSVTYLKPVATKRQGFGQNQTQPMPLWAGSVSKAIVHSL